MLPKTRRRFEKLEDSLEYRKSDISRLRDDIWVLQGALKRLEEYLHIVEVRTNTIKYEKKGGPEQR